MRTITMDKHFKLTPVYILCEEGGYTAYIKEMRGVISQGETIEDARVNLIEALELMLDFEREEFEKTFLGSLDSSVIFSSKDLEILA